MIVKFYDYISLRKLKIKKNKLCNSITNLNSVPLLIVSCNV